MKESGTSLFEYSGKLLAKNIFYNILGYGIPIIFALIAIPFLVRGLGEERFGILSLAWIVIGYFSLFDFGLGRALIKVVAEKLGLNQSEEIPKIFWTSFLLMLFLSIIATILLILLIPFLVFKFFNISEDIQTETLNTFYLLSLAIPIVTTTTGIRGFLEAHQKFGIINIIKIILGVFSFLGPLICLIFTNNMVWVIFSLLILRIIVWILYLIKCYETNLELKKITFDFTLIKPLFKLSFWMSISNIIAPLIVYLDRFIIGALISVAALTYYVTPFEIVTRLLIIPTALTGVLFPTFSTNYLINPSLTKRLTSKAINYVYIFMYPIILTIITFANEGMTLWLGNKFAENSTLILQLLAAGIFFNCIAFIPYTFLQGIGKPETVAKIHIIDLPINTFLLLIAITYWGIIGASFVFLLRTALECLVLLLFLKKSFKTKFIWDLKIFIFLFFIAVLLIPFGISALIIKFLFLLGTLVGFLFLVWTYVLQEQERLYVISKLRIRGLFNFF